MKIKLFTHTDLDGVGCSILLKTVLGENVDVTYCDYHNVDDRVLGFINSSLYENYTHIFITDISVNDNVATLLDQINNDSKDLKVVLLDHHATAKWLAEKYEWATVSPVYNNGVSTSGTSLLLDYLKYNHRDLLTGLSLDCFTEIVRKYDTWDWERAGDTTPKHYNDLLHLIGRNRFIKKMVDKITCSGEHISLSKDEMFLIDLNQEKINRYISNVKVLKYNFSDLVGHIDKDYKVGVVFAEQNTSELGNVVCKNNPDIDFVIILNFLYKTYSFRSVKDNINVGKIAEQYFDGGGHPKAAGAQMSKKQIANVLGILFN